MKKEVFFKMYITMFLVVLLPASILLAVASGFTFDEHYFDSLFFLSFVLCNIIFLVLYLMIWIREEITWIKK